MVVGGESYVDENEFTVLAFHLPGYSFTQLKIWPRKYLTSSQAASDAAAATPTVDDTAAGAVESAAGGVGGPRPPSLN